ncbi:hypothetical protein JOF56_006664 [Kibdelosporangium banguiense]|uniref:DUF397 domain-containing protein n=1 Tax=Kibdelosporangium banguiense TaxID=1365924 RepID=A0ABS4TPF9_9PSEU|nr:DUF397 domain-containing protein [Kibdelosporangium banguiense]MBP2326279.1 hypothetical protein [Kibdelosporangium banguiense]
MDRSGPTWRKSSYSSGGGGGACVELASAPLSTAVRDSKSPSSGVLTFPAAPWATFLTALRAE